MFPKEKVNNLDSVHKTSATLVDALETSARRVPDRGIAIFDRRGQNAERRSYAELSAAALRAAWLLAAAGIAPGDRVLISLPTSWNLLEIYFGAIYRGAFPVLLAPSGALGGAAAHSKKIVALLEMLGPKRFICDESTRQQLLEFDADADTNAMEAASLSLTYAELIALAPVPGMGRRNASPGDLAFMQLTSGSTGRARAVKIKHSSVVHNALAMGHATGVTESDRVVCWLPLNHDMGLVGCLMFSLVHGLDLWLLRPDTFLARPKLWLQTLSKHGGTLSPAPNFAYQLCVERVKSEELDGVDLAQWRCALTGAEMIRPETCAAFNATFAASQFAPQHWRPCYGLAEGTLAVTIDTKCEGIRSLPVSTGLGGDDVNEVVCAGAPVIDTAIRIVAPGGSSESLSDGKIGEIWAKGPGVFAGYYNDEPATSEALHEGWLRTGDLGFLKEGELYITGRTKDLLIINGHNFMPHEFEWIAEGVCGGGGSLRSGAFSVSKGSTGEQAVLIVEAPGDIGDLGALEHDVRSRVGRTLGLPLFDLVFLKRGQIPKTSSGKVQRAELRRRYLDGKLERLNP